VFCPLRSNVAAVKHAPCGPVLLPVDRGPEAAREREGRTPACGHRISLSSIRRHRLTSLNNERGRDVYCHRHGKVKGVRIFADESKHFAARVFLQIRATPMIRGQQIVIAGQKTRELRLDVNDAAIHAAATSQHGPPGQVYSRASHFGPDPVARW